MAYAEKTTVPVTKSRIEIEATLTKYGASSFAYATQDSRAMIAFSMAGRQIRFMVDLPARNLREFTHSSRGARTADAAMSAWEQACRQKWRALALVIKAKLEAVEAGITTVENEFLAHTVLPSGETAGEWLNPQIDQARLSGKMPSIFLLGAPQ